MNSGLGWKLKAGEAQKQGSQDKYDFNAILKIKIDVPQILKEQNTKF